MPREKSIVNAILDYLNSLPNCHARKEHADGYGQSGEPDITCVLEGRAYFFEVKQPGKKARPLQRQSRKRWRAAGAVAEVVMSLSDVKSVLDGTWVSPPDKEEMVLLKGVVLYEAIS